MRREEPGDRAFLLGLYGDGRADELAAVPWSPLDRLRFLGSQFAAQEAHYAANEAAADRWIVTRGDHAIGRLYLAREPRWWRLLEIAIKPGEQRSGIGGALVGWTIEAAAAARAGVELQVVPDNTGAIAFYRRLGFAEAPPHGATRLRMRRPRAPS